MMLRFCSGPAEGGQAVEEWTKPWDRAQMCFEVVRQAETWVGTGKAGLLLEKGWVWSAAEHLTGSRLRVCLWE